MFLPGSHDVSETPAAQADWYHQHEGVPGE
jgi:hypothetical protein